MYRFTMESTDKSSRYYMPNLLLLYTWGSWALCCFLGRRDQHIAIVDAITTRAPDRESDAFHTHLYDSNDNRVSIVIDDRERQRQRSTMCVKKKKKEKEIIAKKRLPA